jgi:hypothetical protein
MPQGVAIGLGSRGNWPGQRQDPWKYINASMPHSKIGSQARVSESDTVVAWQLPRLGIRPSRPSDWCDL